MHKISKFKIRSSYRGRRPTSDISKQSKKSERGNNLNLRHPDCCFSPFPFVVVSDFEFRDADFPAKFLIPASPGWGWRALPAIPRGLKHRATKNGKLLSVHSLTLAATNRPKAGSATPWC
jgi:hypothetical protein